MEKKADATIKACLRLAGLLSWVALLYPPTWLAYKFEKTHWRNRLVRFAYRGILWICGVRLHVDSQPSPARPLLVVSNHISYLDIPILGSVFDVCFTPKMDIAAWPVIGSICSMVGCVFIDRAAAGIGQAKQDISQVLLSGRPVSVFPEATTGNGLEMKSFKSSLFSLAEETPPAAGLTVQPVAIIYKRIGGLPIDRTQWPSVAWYGDMELVPHVWNFLKFGKVDAELAFLEPITLHAPANRKELAARCEQIIMERVEASRRELTLPQTKRLSLSGNLSRSQ